MQGIFLSSWVSFRFLYPTLHIGNCKKKNEGKNYFVWHDICYANLAESLARDLLWLPFWQFAGAVCHFGSTPSLVGDSIYPSHGGLAIPPTHTISRYHTIFPRIVSIISIPAMHNRGKKLDVSSLLEINRAKTIGRFHREQVTLALDLPLCLYHTLLS